MFFESIIETIVSGIMYPIEVWILNPLGNIFFDALVKGLQEYFSYLYF